VGNLDVLVLTVDSTQGWRSSARELTDAFTRAGAAATCVTADRAREVRTFALTDFVQARAARAAGARAIAEHEPAAIVYCSTTAALLWPRPGAVWVDSLAAENRPGRHGVWQRPVERRRLRQAPLVLAMSSRSLGPLAEPRPRSVVAHSPVEASGPPAALRDIAVLAYAADPRKRRLELLLSEWRRARRAGETLLVAGTDPRDPVEGVEWVGRLPHEEYRALLRRTQVFMAAPRHEDYGIAALEALADGCLLATTPASGPYPALALARQLDSRLVGNDLARAVRVGLDDPRPGYAERARELLVPFGRDALQKTVAEQVLPRLAPA
jgi:hypothetical protein